MYRLEERFHQTLAVFLFAVAAGAEEEAILILKILIKSLLLKFLEKIVTVLTMAFIQSL